MNKNKGLKQQLLLLNVCWSFILAWSSAGWLQDQLTDGQQQQHLGL